MPMYTFGNAWSCHIAHSSLFYSYNYSIYPYSQEFTISLSTIVLNSRDWSEIIWLLEISCFKINLAISFIQKTHWNALVRLYNDAVSSLNGAKTRIFQPTANFENFEIRLYFVSQPAVRPSCARYRAPESSHYKGNGGGFTNMLF